LETSSQLHESNSSKRENFCSTGKISAIIVIIVFVRRQTLFTKNMTQSAHGEY